MHRSALLSAYCSLHCGQTSTRSSSCLPNHSYACRYLQPLAMQIVMLPLNLFESQLFKVHVLGQAPQGALARPWKEDNPFAA